MIVQFHGISKEVLQGYIKQCKTHCIKCVECQVNNVANNAKRLSPSTSHILLTVVKTAFPKQSQMDFFPSLSQSMRYVLKPIVSLILVLLSFMNLPVVLNESFMYMMTNSSACKSNIKDLNLYVYMLWNSRGISVHAFEFS